MEFDVIEVQRLYAINEKAAISIKSLLSAGMMSKAAAAEKVVLELHETNVIQTKLINQLAHNILVLNQDIQMLKERAGL